MTNKPHVWLRAESRPTERRTPLTPTGAKRLLELGFDVTVEQSETRIFADQEFNNAGCALVASGSWVTAPADAIVLGLKELPEKPDQLNHVHILFGHAYKEQHGWKEFLGRFKSGGGTLLDIEYMTEENGRRVAAFGYWAGYMGAALALQHWYSLSSGRSSLDDALTPFENADALDKLLDAQRKDTERAPTVVVIGALGRSGRGACDLAERHGAKLTRWDLAETNPLDREALLEHDIFINCALITNRIEPFLTRSDLDGNANLSVISDVSCDPTSEINPLPFYNAVTEWDRPYLSFPKSHSSACTDLIAIDNLPSLLPRESSEDFAGLLLPHLEKLSDWKSEVVWQRTQACFDDAVTRAGL